MSTVRTYRFINDICLNPKEYLLDDDGEIKSFETKQDAINYLINVNDTDEDHGVPAKTEGEFNDFGIYFEEKAI